MGSKDIFFEEYRKACIAEPNNPRAGLHVLFAKFIKEKMEQEENKQRAVYWITINPKPDISFDYFRNLIIERLFDRVIMKGAVCAFEQRSKEAPYSGVHCHILVDKRMGPKKMFTRIFNTVNHIVGNPKHVDIREYPYTYREEKLDYLRGKKWDPAKDPSVQATLQWRKDNNISDLYEA